MKRGAGAENDQLFFETLKVDRGWYFVEYGPPVASAPFATLHLVVPGTIDAGRVATAMEEELITWLQRYPVPIMVSSFDGTDNVVGLSSIRACDHVTGWRERNSGTIATHWRLVADAEFPQRTWDVASLKRIYEDVPVRSARQIQESFQKRQRSITLGRRLLFVTAVGVPAVVGLVEFNAPRWLAFLVLVYSLLGPYILAWKLLGKWPKSESELASEDEKRQMEHHHYHCQRNPEGFRRLRRENFEREAREQIQREAAAVKKVSGRAQE